MFERVIFVLLLLVEALGVYALFFRKGSEELRKRPSAVKVLIAMTMLWVIAFMLIGLFKFSGLLAFLMVFPWVAHNLTTYTGMNSWLAVFFSVPLTFFLIWGISQCFSWRDPKKRFRGVLILAGTIMVASLAMYYVEKDYYFDRRDGKAEKFVSYDPITGEPHIFDQPIYDPFGQKAVPITTQIAAEIRSRKIYPNTEISIDRVDAFFDRFTGKPKIWYDLVGTKYHFFVQPGFSPITGEKLKPITREIVISLYEDFKSGNTERISAVGDSASPGSVNVLSGLAELKKTLKDLHP